MSVSLFTSLVIYVSKPTYPSIYLSIHPSTDRHTCLSKSIYLSIQCIRHPSIYPSIYRSTDLSMCVSLNICNIYLPAHVCLYVCMSVCLHVCTSVSMCACTCKHVCMYACKHRHPRFEGWILGGWIRVGFEGQNQFSQLCSSIFRHRVSSCCSISLFMYFNSNFSTGGTAHGSLESICLDPGVGQKRQAH